MTLFDFDLCLTAFRLALPIEEIGHGIGVRFGYVEDTLRCVLKQAIHRNIS